MSSTSAKSVLLTYTGIFWDAAMARQLFPLVNKYNYEEKPKPSVTAPNIQSVSYTSAIRDEIKLVFDQEVKWDEDVAERFYFDDDSAKLTAVEGTGRTITLKLAQPSATKNLTYVRGGKWRQDDTIIWGANNIAALTFCEVPIRLPKD